LYNGRTETRVGEIIQNLCGYSGERRKDIDTFYQKVVRTFSERTEKTPAHYPGTAMDKRQV